MRAALACALLFPALPACADGPALAHLTLAGSTITLTETTPIEDGAPWTFAQMHLGFPLPPILQILLSPDDTTLRRIILNTTGTALEPETFLWFELAGATVTSGDQAILIETEALSRTPLGQLTALPVRIEVQLTSP